MAINEGALVYSPWLRFIKEPYDFIDKEIKGEYIVKAFLYVARQNKIEAKICNYEDNVASLILKINLKALPG